MKQAISRVREVVDGPVGVVVLVVMFMYAAAAAIGLSAALVVYR
jgi:hypothetical protein